jgi:hypothetical protein
MTPGGTLQLTLSVDTKVPFSCRTLWTAPCEHRGSCLNTPPTRPRTDASRPSLLNSLKTTTTTLYLLFSSLEEEPDQEDFYDENA